MAVASLVVVTWSSQVIIVVDKKVVSAKTSSAHVGIIGLKCLKWLGKVSNIWLLVFSGFEPWTFNVFEQYRKLSFDCLTPKCFWKRKFAVAAAVLVTVFAFLCDCIFTNASILVALPASERALSLQQNKRFLGNNDIHGISFFLWRAMPSPVDFLHNFGGTAIVPSCGRMDSCQNVRPSHLQCPLVLQIGWYIGLHVSAILSSKCVPWELHEEVAWTRTKYAHVRNENWCQLFVSM